MVNGEVQRVEAIMESLLLLIFAIGDLPLTAFKQTA